MIGIPYRLVRQDENGGVVDKVIYLATRRSGPDGEALRKAKLEYRRQQLDMAKAFSSHKSADAALAGLKPEDERYATREAGRDRAFDELAKAESAALAAATEIARLSLTSSYGPDKAAEIMDLLTDADLHAIVTTLQTGEQPADFSRSPEAGQKPTTMSPPGASPAGSSSNTGSAPERSPEAK